MFNDNNNLKRSVGQMERHAFDNFDSFDPEMYDPEMYDPSSAVDPNFFDDENDNYTLADGYTQMNKMTKKRRMANSPLAQVDIIITSNTGATATTVELFNYLRSNTIIRNTVYNSTTFEPQTLDKTVAYSTPASATLSDAQMIYWRSDGSLVYNKTAGSGTTMGTATVIISCPQVPFRVLHEATRNNALYIEKFRLSVGSSTQTGQFDNTITYFKNTFLGGTKSNQIAPRSEFKPNQFQSTIIDVPAKITVDAETGLSLLINAQATLTMTTFFRFIRGNETGFNF